MYTRTYNTRTHAHVYVYVYTNTPDRVSSVSWFLVRDEWSVDTATPRVPLRSRNSAHRTCRIPRRTAGTSYTTLFYAYVRDGKTSGSERLVRPFEKPNRRNARVRVLYFYFHFRSRRIHARTRSPRRLYVCVYTRYILLCTHCIDVYDDLCATRAYIVRTMTVIRYSIEKLHTRVPECLG